jgi:hypothetical protein
MESGAKSFFSRTNEPEFLVPLLRNIALAQTAIFMYLHGRHCIYPIASMARCVTPIMNARSSLRGKSWRAKSVIIQRRELDFDLAISPSVVGTLEFSPQLFS